VHEKFAVDIDLPRRVRDAAVTEVTERRQQYPSTAVGLRQDARNGASPQSDICSTSLHRLVMCTATALPM